MSARKPRDDPDEPKNDGGGANRGLPYWLSEAPRHVDEAEILQAFRNPAYDQPRDAWPDHFTGDSA